MSVPDAMAAWSLILMLAVAVVVAVVGVGMAAFRMADWWDEYYNDGVASDYGAVVFVVTAALLLSWIFAIVAIVLEVFM